MKNASAISVVLPAYNEAGNIDPVYQALARLFASELSTYQAEFIFVNDGSSDDTAGHIRRLMADDPRVKLICFTRNFGHQAALAAGLDKAGGDAVITMDCDLQHPPALIPEMIRHWREGPQVVYARRRTRNDGAFKQATSNLYYKMLNRFSDVEMPRQVSDFRLIDRAVREYLVNLNEHALYLRGYVAWLGFKYAIVEYDQADRRHGETHYTLQKMARLAMDGLLSFSNIPLKFGLWIGVLTMLVALFFFVYIFYQHFILGIFYQLYKWLMVVLFGFVGAQFIIMWILGEYVGRIYSDVRRRPLYVVSEQAGFEEKTN